MPFNIYEFTEVDSIAATVFVIPSIIVNIILFCNINRNTSSHSQLISTIVISECILLFCLWELVLENDIMEVKEWIYTILNYFTINVFKALVGDFKTFFEFSKILMLSLVYSTQTLIFCLHIFICLEIIFSLKNPFWPAGLRFKIYNVIGYFLSGSIFVLKITSLKVQEKDGYILMKTIIWVNLILFCLFFLVGTISTIYLMKRFCRKNFASSVTTVYILRHFIYAFLFLNCYGVAQLNGIFILMDTTLFSYRFIFLTILSSGVILGLIRVGETKLRKYIYCCGRFFRNSSKKSHRKRGDSDLSESEQSANEESDHISLDEFKFNKEEDKQLSTFFSEDQPLSALIAKTLNLEFMCCILFGLSQIYIKEEKRLGRIMSTCSEIENLLISNSKDKEEREWDLVKDKSYSKDKSFTNKEVTEKDFIRAKKHKIFYSQIINLDDNEQLDIAKNSKTRSLNYTSNSFDESYLDDLSIKDSHSPKKKSSHRKIANKADGIIIEYCPKIFKFFRNEDGITANVLASSLEPFENKDNITKINESGGKSGSFFFQSHDKRFLIKTISKDEVNTLIKSFLKSFYKHIKENPDSLITRIYGVYEIQISSVTKINIILMQNLTVFPFKFINRIFDLKGSMFQRNTKNLIKTLSKNKLTALKDQDFIWMVDIDKHLVDFKDEDRKAIDLTLKKDSDFLREGNLMDYSLLLLIVNNPSEESEIPGELLDIFNETNFKRMLFKSKDNKYLYILGIIDYLQNFNIKKFLENKYKGLLHKKDAEMISAVDPLLYSTRFYDFMTMKVIKSRSWFITHKK